MFNEKDLFSDIFLSANDLYVDLGVYQGHYIDYINSNYHCRIIGCEPVNEFYHALESRYKDHNNIKLYNIAIDNYNDFHIIELYQNGSSICGLPESIYNTKEGEQLVKVMNIKTFYDIHINRKINLLKINVEGSEFHILKEMIDKNVIDKVDNIIVQFHEFFDPSHIFLDEIRQKLSYTHNEIMFDPYVWCKWTLK